MTELNEDKLKGAYIHPVSAEIWDELCIILEQAGYGDYTDEDIKTKDSVLAIYPTPGAVFHFKLTDIYPVMQNLKLDDVDNEHWIDFGFEPEQFLEYAQVLLNNIKEINEDVHSK